MVGRVWPNNAGSVRYLIVGLIVAASALAFSGGRAAASKPSQCDGDTSGLCYVLQPAGGGGEFVFSLFVPRGSAASEEIKHVEIETTVPMRTLRPGNLCKSSGSRVGTGPDGSTSDPFQGTYYVTTCRTAIKAGDTFQMCFNDGNATPATTPAGTWLFFSAPPVGRSYSGVDAAVRRCPAPKTEKL
jgi:hypothetical protein